MTFPLPLPMSLQLTRTQLTSIADAFGFPHVSPAELLPVGGGYSGAGIWKWESHNPPYALRRWPQNTLPKSRLLGLHRLLRWWGDNGFPEFAIPLPTTDGSTLLQLDSHLWQMEPWMPGRADFHAHPSEDRLKSAMHWLARLHLATPRFLPDPAAREWFQSFPASPSPAVSERLSLIHSWNPERIAAHRSQIPRIPDQRFHTPLLGFLDQFPRHAPGIATELQLATRLSVPLFPSLRDLWHDHLLFTGEQLSAVIDPAHCRTESAPSDLSRLLGSLFPLEKNSWDRALEFYTSLRPLTPDEYQLLEVLDRSQILLSGLHWVERLTTDSPLPSDPTSLANRLETLHKRLDTL